MPDAEWTWSNEAKVEEYLDRLPKLRQRAAGEAALVEVLPLRVERALDLGCGDGRLAELVLTARPDAVEVVGMDRSRPMLERANARLASDERAQVVEHDLVQPLPSLGTFDAVVSGFAIHHLEDDQKRRLLTDVARALAPNGVFANLDVVQCATPELQEEFHQAIGRPGGDPEDRLAPVEEQLQWMRDVGLEQVDCMWRWRGFALLVGRGAA